MSTHGRNNGDGEGGDRADALRTSVRALTDGRTAADYLRGAVPEVADPTGLPRRAFEGAVVDIEHQCRAVAAWLTDHVAPPAA